MRSCTTTCSTDLRLWPSVRVWPKLQQLLIKEIVKSFKNLFVRSSQHLDTSEQADFTLSAIASNKKLSTMSTRESTSSINYLLKNASHTRSTQDSCSLNATEMHTKYKVMFKTLQFLMNLKSHRIRKASSIAWRRARALRIDRNKSKKKNLQTCAKQDGPSPILNSKTCLRQTNRDSRRKLRRLDKKKRKMRHQTRKKVCSHCMTAFVMIPLLAQMII